MNYLRNGDTRLATPLFGQCFTLSHWSLLLCNIMDLSTGLGVIIDLLAAESHNINIPMRRRIIMLVGYARTSTDHQKAGLEAQLVELAKLGVERVFSEQVSAVGHRRI